MQADTQNYSLPTVNNGVSAEQSPPPIDTQNTLTSTNVRLRKKTFIFHKNVFFVRIQSFIIRPQLAESTLIDENSISVETGS